MMVTQSEMEARIVRYGDLVPCTAAFIDARTPGSDKKENFTIIGPGVSENPGQHIHVAIPHGFNIGGARQPKGCLNSQHSHETAEVFLVHSGQWAFRCGHDAKDAEVLLKKGDTISIPVNVFRGFECLSDGDSFLFAILGGDDPGHVTWAPYVFEAAKGHGLVLLANGQLIDTVAGESPPAGATVQRATSMADIGAFRRMTQADLDARVISPNEIDDGEATVLTNAAHGVREGPVLGPANAHEGIRAGKVAAPHGFQFRRFVLEPHAQLPRHARVEEEVLFVHEGGVMIAWVDGEIALARGDSFTIPKGLYREWRARSTGATVFVVRGGDRPSAPRME